MTSESNKKSFITSLKLFSSDEKSVKAISKTDEREGTNSRAVQPSAAELSKH
jgi:hypothetical protein